MGGGGFAVALAVVLLVARPGDARECAATVGRHAVVVSGEVAGTQAHRQSVGRDWTFALEPAPHGWHLRLYDPRGLDLTQFTPPFRLAPNPRELFGWHFRNAANTGPNQGDVNAPQRLRLFVFAAALGTTGGFKPSDPMPSGFDPAESDGRGWLEILDYGLADLEPGRQARLVYLKFDACLTWPVTAGEAATGLPDPTLTARFAACGLAAPLQLSAHVSPPALHGDIDGDGTPDVIAPIVRQPDGKRGLAVCRAGGRLDVIGLAGTMGHLTPEYFDRFDHWELHPRGGVNQGVAEGPPPALVGDAILLGLEEKSSVLLYWTGERYAAYWQGD